MFGYSFRKDVPEVKEVEASVGIASRSNPKPKHVDSSGKEFTIDASTALSSDQAITTSEVIFTCIDFISSAAAQARFAVYTREAKTQNKIPFNNKAVLKAFNTNPTPTSTWSETLGIAATQILLDGESFISMELVGKQFEFTVIDSDTTVEILFEPEHPEIPTGYKIGDEEYSLEEMIHVKRVNIKGSLNGQSVLASLIDPLVIDGYASNDLISLYENGSVGEVYLSSDSPLAESQVDRIERKLTQKYTKAGRHRTYVLPNGLEPKTLRISPKDAVILEAMQISEDRLLRAFKLHKAILGGVIESYTHDMQSLATVQFNQAVRPVLNLIKDKMEMTLRKKLKKDDVYLEIDYQNLPEISRALTVHTEVARQIYSSGLGSLNEARDLIGLVPLEDPLANENFLPEFLHGSSLMSIQGLDSTQLDTIREAKVAEAQAIIDGGDTEEIVEEGDGAGPTEPIGSDDAEGGTPNNEKEEN